MARTTFAVAGQPIDGSASPHLFHLVVAHLARRGVQGIDEEHIESFRVNATSVGEALRALLSDPPRHHSTLASAADDVVRASTPQTNEGAGVSLPRDGALWLSLTSPLKHDLGAWDHLDASKDVQSVNTLRVLDGRVEAMSTDGRAVVRVARLRGVSVDSGAVVALRGGGGAARSIAQAWVEDGGRVLPVPGRRALSGLPEDAVATHVAAFGVDVDGGEDLLDAPCVLYPAYRVGDAPRGGGRLASSEIDGRWMLAAQHLEAWSRCWAPDVAPFLPDVPRLVEDLLALEARLGTDARDA